jgi:uncharacterized protein YhaN
MILAQNKTQMSIINDNHHQQKSSTEIVTEIINGDRQNTHKEVMCIWNENQHGERQSSMMIITKRESLYSRWKMGIVMDGMKMVVV